MLSWAKLSSADADETQAKGSYPLGRSAYIGRFSRTLRMQKEKASRMGTPQNSETLKAVTLNQPFF